MADIIYISEPNSLSSIFNLGSIICYITEYVFPAREFPRTRLENGIVKIDSRLFGFKVWLVF